MHATSQLLRAAAADLPPVSSTEVAATLSVRAGLAYDIFADAGETPRWLSVVQSAHVLERDAAGRPLRVAFRASFDRAILGYVLHYAYRPDDLVVSWTTAAASAMRVEGEARFAALSDRACLMTYRLTLDLPVTTDWLEEHYDGHAASAVVGDFREYLRRMK
jgi:hypothetical protein